MLGLLFLFLFLWGGRGLNIEKVTRMATMLHKGIE